MRATMILVVITLWSAMPAACLADVRCIDPDEKTGTSLAVVVGAVGLVYTGQALPLDTKGKLVGKDEPLTQISYVVGNLFAALTKGGVGVSRIVKINVYVTRPQLVDDVKTVLAQRIRGPVKPAVSFVVGALPHADALVAMDAMAALPDSGEGAVTRGHFQSLPRFNCGAHVAAVPSGPLVYVSGQAEKGSLAEATRRTLESLRATLKFLGLEEAHIVQIKAFVTPMNAAPTVEQEMTQFFGKQSVPPVVFVEWKSSLPIEIELIAAAPRPKEKPADALDFLTPPGMTASPIYSRVTRINHGKTIYVSGLYGLKAKDATGEIEEIFTTLSDVLKKTGSDMRHLAKATYYVSTDEASRKLNELRPKYYDPKRPPSASKAMVPGVGTAGRSVTLDMIAVPRP